MFSTPGFFFFPPFSFFAVLFPRATYIADEGAALKKQEEIWQMIAADNTKRLLALAAPLSG